MVQAVPPARDVLSRACLWFLRAHCGTMDSTAMHSEKHLLKHMFIPFFLKKVKVEAARLVFILRELNRRSCLLTVKFIAVTGKKTIITRND